MGDKAPETAAQLAALVRELLAQIPAETLAALDESDAQVVTLMANAASAIETETPSTDRSATVLIEVTLLTSLGIFSRVALPSELSSKLAAFEARYPRKRRHEAPYRLEKIRIRRHTVSRIPTVH